MATGLHRIEYEVLEGWEQLPEGWALTEVAGVAVDSHDRVYVFCRGEHPVIVFDKEGKFLDAWGEGQFVRPHGIYISPKDELFLVDDEAHSVYRYSLDGTRLMKIGGTPSDTGFGRDESPVMQAAGPFNWVTNVAQAPDGTLYAADGYGNARVHHFAADGTLLHSWGTPGNDYGQFNLPHGIAVDRSGRVYVCDRENARIQIFSGDGDVRAGLGLGQPADRHFYRRPGDDLHRRIGLSGRQQAVAPVPHPLLRPPRPRADRPGHASAPRTARSSTASAARKRCCPATSSPPTACGPTARAASTSAK